MTVDVILTAGAVDPEQTAGRTAVVIDVFRATTVMTEALVNGARAVIPVATIEEARSRADGFGQGTFVLAGERNAVRIEGFDLGNSPVSFTAEAVEGKTVIQTTTNGTMAISNLIKAGNHGPLLIASFLNMVAAARAAAGEGGDTVLVCSGREGEFTMEDGLCAGAIAGILCRRYDYGQSDIALAMSDLWDRYGDNPEQVLRSTRHYRYLADRGFGTDIAFSLGRNIYDVVPRLYPDGEVRLQ